MSDVAIHVDHVWKKFRKGEIHDSLRELIPAAFKRLTGRGPKRSDLNQSEFWALKDVSFEVKQGESLGIIGPNGAGKSTMLKVLSRIMKPNRGEYRVKGRLSALIEVGAGFHPDLTGRENIYLNGTILGMNKAEIKAREEEIIDFSGVESFIDTPVKRYSSGMGARLGFAIAAHLRTDVLLVDEVLSVGDARFRHKCVQHMNKLLKSGITVIFISHILDQVRALCPRTIVLDKGAVAYNGDTDGAIREYLQLLGTNEKKSTEAGTALVDVRNIRITALDGKLEGEWRVGRPGLIDFEMVSKGQYSADHILINVSTISGFYLGTFNSQVAGPTQTAVPGRYRVSLRVDSMPLADGDYLFEILICGYDEANGWKYNVNWQSPQPRVVTVRGDVPGSQLIEFSTQWTICPQIPDSKRHVPAISNSIREIANEC